MSMINLNRRFKLGLFLHIKSVHQTLQCIFKMSFFYTTKGVTCPTKVFSERGEKKPWQKHKALFRFVALNCSSLLTGYAVIGSCCQCQHIHIVCFILLVEKLNLRDFYDVYISSFCICLHVLIWQTYSSQVVYSRVQISDI